MNIKVTNNSNLPTESNLKKNLHTFILFDEKHSNPLLQAFLKQILKDKTVKLRT